jgi:hypothetical protein
MKDLSVRRRFQARLLIDVTKSRMYAPLDPPGEAFLKGLCTIFAGVLCVVLIDNPAYAKTPTDAPLGIVVTADHAHVGQSPADVGTTVYGGDSLSTEAQGNVQVRAGAAARLLLLDSTIAVVNDNEGTHSAKLIQGTAIFSTGNARAFTLFASKAAINAQTDAPTIGQVTYVNEKELIVFAKRGDLRVTVDDESQVIQEGTAFRVLLDPEVAQEPAGAGTKNQGPVQGGPPIRAGRSHFMLVMIVAIAAGTTFAAIAAYESPFNW